MALLTVEEVAAKLRMSEYVIRMYLREGKLRGAKIGRVWRIDEKDLNEFIEKAKSKKG